MKRWNKNINIPNALTLLRIVLIIPFVYFFMNGNILAAVACLVLSGLSDMFDGMIARRFNQFTELGKMLDPVADKLTQVTIVVCIAVEHPILIPLLAIFVIKELLMMAGAAYLVFKLKKRPSASKWYGKGATVMFYVSVTVIVGLKGIWNIESLPLSVTLLSITALMMLYALYEYFKIFRQLLHSSDPKDTIDLRADIRGETAKEAGLSGSPQDAKPKISKAGDSPEEAARP